MNALKISLCFSLFYTISAIGQLAVTVSPPKMIAQKTIVTLAMTNNLAEPVESARAVCFLMDAKGQMVGQSSKWVIGGSKDRPALSPKTGTAYNFVITTPELLTATNFTAKISFTRLVLSGNQIANPTKDVIIEQSKKN